MEEVVDARGLPCPTPVVKTREALQRGCQRLEVLVDNPTARDNVTRFAASQGCSVEVSEEDGMFHLYIMREGGPEEAACATATAESPSPSGEKRVVVLSSDVMGRGEEELGRILMKAFLNTLAESERRPWRLVLFNRGVLLAVEGADTLPALKELASRGVEVLVCGTCLDYFGAKDKVAAGTVSNMFEILETMLVASNSVTV
ncbi:sulfurtransferase-like selenium metabolism protein YedF [Candidatus Solincola tengchongensis]|uniref:sulfurtransferase-like selenium metabolism protein YedF n=1 Tax=Candidatus Solincola tengchongensis TaxID=2900693 RepID=UPI00257E7821|nr:sulfurtransferase-like selenium metabolism protein YedF [Candidatus Solincola tengchongensis]